MPDCEAEERNKRAAYELELQWGSGRIDLGRIKNILTGTETCTHQPGSLAGSGRMNG